MSIKNKYKKTNMRAILGQFLCAVNLEIFATAVIFYVTEIPHLPKVSKVNRTVVNINELK